MDSTRPRGGVGGDPTAIDVRFDCGKDLLSSYWGYLAHGGLIIPDDAAIEVDEPVALNVVIASAGTRYQLRGRMLRRHEDGSRMVVAFDPNQPHDLLVSQALAETENTPTRKHRRYRIDLCGRAASRDVRVVNVSVGGMCLTFKGDPPATVGDPVVVETESMRFEGVVQWASGREIGVRFTSSEGIREDAMELVETFLSRLR